MKKSRTIGLWMVLAVMIVLLSSAISNAQEDYCSEGHVSKVIPTVNIVDTSYSFEKFLPYAVWNPDDLELGISYLNYTQEEFLGARIYLGRFDENANLLSATKIDDVECSFSSSFIRWTGSSYGVFWREQNYHPTNICGSGGYPDQVAFAAVDAQGNKIVDAKQITSNTKSAYLESVIWNPDSQEYAFTYIEEATPDNFEVYLQRADAQGNLIGSRILVSDTPEYSAGSSVIWTGSKYVVIWNEDSPYFTIYFARISQSGTIELKKQAIDYRLSGLSNIIRDSSIYVFGNGVIDGNPHLIKLDMDGNILSDEILGFNIGKVKWNGVEYYISRSIPSGDETDIYFSRADENEQPIESELYIGNGRSDSPVFFRSSFVWTGSEYIFVWANEDSVPGVYFTKLGCLTCEDIDGDGYGTGTEEERVSCLYQEEDCDDSDASVHPGASEICNGIDDDCDPSTADGSGEEPPLNSLQKGVCAGSLQTCVGTAGWQDDISSILAYEPAEESCNDGLDNDCDGLRDCEDPDCEGSAYCNAPIQYLYVPKASKVYLATFDVSGSRAVNPGIDIGMDGYYEWGAAGEFNGRQSMADFSGLLNDYINDSCDADIDEICQIPVEIRAQSGVLSITDIKIQYHDYFWNTSLLPNGIFYQMMLFAEEKEICGNGKVEGGEQCDDGNTEYFDGCSGKCTLEGVWGFECVHMQATCPDEFGFIEVLKKSSMTDAHAALPNTGDFANRICCKVEGATLDTTCDNGDAFLELSSEDDAHVEVPAEGGFTNPACMSIQETSRGSVICDYNTGDCDEGYSCVASVTSESDAHIGDCDDYNTKICCAVGMPVCGNGDVEFIEECDNGTANSDTAPDECRTDCTLPSCGDGVVDSGEECDDGNKLNGDGCTADCVIETGLVCSIGQEACTEATLFTMYGLYDSHIGTAGYYDNNVCCNLAEAGLTATDCSGAEDEFVLSKYGTDNSHVSLTQGYYDSDICMAADTGAITCHEYAGSGTCDTGTCVATVYKNDDSHVAGCAGDTASPYTKTICCEYSS
ncbi:DUF4215 domain-containing protein [Candidatus Woesearchaeota archaeon]|nr:DUF4215 domain-containing protein [Candidatus Woesearchaeota archaeon]